MERYVDWAAKPAWQTYSKEMRTEFQQLVEEGKDVEKYRALFEAVRDMPDCAEKARLADVLFDLTEKAGTVEGYPYVEPNDIEEIRALRPAGHAPAREADKHALYDKISGAWYGRICGCLLGKPVEGARTEALIPFFKQCGNYPVHRYVLSTDVPESEEERAKYRFLHLCFADKLASAPIDDDTNYTVLAQELVKRYGRDFTSHNVAALWQMSQPVTAYCTAERVAICNLINGVRPPLSAVFQNPYREWIGAQIRADYFGYINPGDPEAAAEMAWRDARISHVKNGIYGEMFAAAMIAEAAVTSDIMTIIRAGLGEIPEKCRLARDVNVILDGYEKGVTKEEAFARIHEMWDEHTGHGWCHTISNAMIVAASLLYGSGDYSASICMAVETGFDTDCNGATVGSVLGMRGGISAVGDAWRTPVKGTLDTSIIGVGRVSVESLVKTTLKHIEDK